MWMSEALALIAFSIRRFTSRTTGASKAMSGREPLDERRARRELVPLDVRELEAPGERPGNLFGAREPEAHDGIREALARGAATVLGAGEIRLRKEARGRQPLAQRNVPIRFHVFRAIHTRRGSGPHRPRFLGPGFLASRPLIVSGLCKTGGTFLTTRGRCLQTRGSHDGPDSWTARRGRACLDAPPRRRAPRCGIDVEPGHPGG